MLHAESNAWVKMVPVWVNIASVQLRKVGYIDAEFYFVLLLSFLPKDLNSFASLILLSLNIHKKWIFYCHWLSEIAET